MECYKVISNTYCFIVDKGLLDGLVAGEIVEEMR